ncbi:hypothetical protein EDB89DRAFT_1910110 [Lactarius sanguifluus]|nr:hypothetical protein EDB89DRAFT_1910589 [Lactarius sanguifluus]KAH9167294.1 hypothetical protein EDB89DRAFT_1910110 [Lactarius sanguifluus]
MSNSFLRSPRPRYDLVENLDLPPSTSNHNVRVVPRWNGYQPDANYAGVYRGPNHTDYGHGVQYRDNPWYEGPPPPAANWEGQYAHQTSPNIGYPTFGNAQHMPVPPGPSHGEYNIPPAHAMPDVADAFSSNVPDSAPSEMSAMENLKRLSDRYLHHPGSRVGALRMGLSPSGGRLRVMITLDIDV